MLVTTTAQDVFAEKTNATQTTMIPSKQNHTKGTTTQGGTGSKNFGWNDCFGQPQSGWFSVNVNNPMPSSYLTYKWSWPSYDNAGFVCTHMNFQSVQQWFYDIGGNWSAFSQNEPSYANTNGKTYQLIGVQVNAGDIVYGEERACYDTTSGGCADGHTFDTPTFVANTGP